MVYTKKGKKILDSLVESINSFDLFYEMSDSNSLYLRNQKIEENILNQLKNCNISSTNYIINNLDNIGKQIWDRYFKNKL